MFLRRLAIASTLAALTCVSFPAKAAQNSVCMPTSGIVSGLTFSLDVTAGLSALLTTNSGSSAPANDCTAAAVVGQQWLDTSANPYLYNRLFDGTSWIAGPAYDIVNHRAVPQVGGGTNTLASATVTDLGAVNEATVIITGNVTIAGFGSSALLGTRHLIIFSGAPSITYNATSMILPGGQSIQTAAGDVWEAIYLGNGNWRVVSITQANGTPLSSVPAGTVVDYGGLNAPSGWLFSNGDAVSRSTYSVLFSALTYQFNGGISSGSPTVSYPSGIPSTIVAGMPVCGTGIQSGSVVVTNTGTAITISLNATTTTTTTVTVAPYGCGDNSTTFNLPDLRERVVAGGGTMGGASDPTRMTTSYSCDGTRPGSGCGAQTSTLTTAQLPSTTVNSTASASLSVSGTAAGSVSVSDTRTWAVAFFKQTTPNGSTTTFNFFNNDATPNVNMPLTQTGGSITAAFSGGSISGTASGTVSSSGSFGSGTPHAIVQPSIIMNKIIKF